MHRICQFICIFVGTCFYLLQFVNSSRLLSLYIIVTLFFRFTVYLILQVLFRRTVYQILYIDQVYCVPVGGMCVHQPLSIGGSGSTYLYGLMDSRYFIDLWTPGHQVPLWTYGLQVHLWIYGLQVPLWTYGLKDSGPTNATYLLCLFMDLSHQRA